MSLINRPFRGFSGVYTMPLPPLPTPSSTNTSIDSQRSTSSTSITSPDSASKPRHKLFHRSKSRANLKAPAMDANRPAPPSRAHTAEVNTPPKPSHSFLAGLFHRERKERAPSAEEQERELEQLYVAMYTKAERRAFFREWKEREAERDNWEEEKYDEGEEWER